MENVGFSGRIKLPRVGPRGNFDCSLDGAHRRPI
jgi:hypothetical protein